MEYPSCECFNRSGPSAPWHEVEFHFDVQDTTCQAWYVLLDYIDDICKRGGEDFTPFEVLGAERYHDIVTLPKEIRQLKSVKKIHLYASNISCIPPDIGEMESLEYFDVYTSNRLHWVPYEIIHCPKLSYSRMSTRRFYGNCKIKPPFPSLKDNPMRFGSLGDSCSVCGDEILPPKQLQQYWVSMYFATDQMPMLASICSDECLSRIFPPEVNRILPPHLGGLENRRRTKTNHLRKPND